MAAGLFACFYVTCCNLFFFSTALVNFDYEIDRSLLESNKDVPMVILGFGSVTSVAFLFIATIKTLGKRITYLFWFKFIFFVALTCYDINDETDETKKKQVNISCISTKMKFNLFRIRRVLMVKNLISMNYQLSISDFLQKLNRIRTKTTQAIW